MPVTTGLASLLDDPKLLAILTQSRVGFVCNPTAITPDLSHGIDKLIEAGVNLVRLFGPEHGVRATAQDMEGVDEQTDPVTGIETISLYGDNEASLRPPAETLADLDIVLFDIQDIGTRYYTYQATLGFVMEVAGTVDTEVWVLDRPNPINGVTVEGNLVHKGFESFVGAYPIAVRHGMTMGELANYFQAFCNVRCETKIIECKDYKRSMWFDETGLPWVLPSPNMPTLETATIYPGMCLIEAMTMSEARGTTRPFHLLGAPGLDPQKFVAQLKACAAEAKLEGVGFRAAAFVPGFQKHKGESCTGAEIHLFDRDKLHALKLGMVAVQAAWKTDRSVWGWRTEPYEFIEDVPAIDLLAGNTLFREMLEQDGSILDVLAAYEDDHNEFLRRREKCLIYA